MNDDERSEGIARTVARIEQCMSAKIRLHKRPDGNDTGDYSKLWGGFTGFYSAYNPCYRMENCAGQQHDESVDVFLARYADPRFKKARYLFLTGDPDGKRDLDDFKAIMRDVYAKAKIVKGKIEVRQIDTGSSGAEVYFGIREGVRTAIMDARTIAQINNRGAAAQGEHADGFTESCRIKNSRLHRDGSIVIDAIAAPGLVSAA